MALARVLAVAAIAGLLAAGAVIDLADRPGYDRAEIDSAGLSVATSPANTWFCPGGSGPDGAAAVTLEFINASPEPAAAIVSVLPSADWTGGDVAEMPVEIEPWARVSFLPWRHVPDAAWVGATVEVDGADVVVEQVAVSDQGGVGRSPCITVTSDRWIVSNGATRLAVEGEQFIVLLLNPFPDFAVADVELVADVGRDSLDGVVVPARRVTALEITDELTEAETVAAFIDVVSGRLAVSWIQLSDGDEAGRGTQVAAAAPAGAGVWYLPLASVSSSSRRDVIAVSNPSTELAAEVDLEFVTGRPGSEISPIEVSVGPQRTALIDLSAEERLEGLGYFSVLARSLLGTDVVVSIRSTVFAGPAPVNNDAPSDATDDQSDEASAAASAAGPISEVQEVPGATAMSGADSAARRWLAPLEVPEAAGDDGPSADASAVAVYNPSSQGIALIDISVAGETVRSLELGPGRRARVAAAELGVGSFTAEIEASAPVVVARELIGLTSRTASLAVAASEPVPSWSGNHAGTPR